MPGDIPAPAGPPSGAHGAAIRVATWNIHGGIGRDGRYAPERIAGVLREMHADVVALQEVASLELHGDFLVRLQRATGFEVVAGPTLSRQGIDFGNALLSRFAVRRVTHIDLAVKHYEPRAALDVELMAGPRGLRVVATHLGLRPSERREQVRRILATIEGETPLPTLLMGDLNEWFLWGRPLRWLHRHFRSVPSPATFPTQRPLFALDRIWIQPAELLRRLDAHATPLSRIASDHLPLVAEVALPVG